MKRLTVEAFSEKMNNHKTRFSFSDSLYMMMPDNTISTE